MTSQVLLRRGARKMETGLEIEQFCDGIFIHFDEEYCDKQKR